MAIGLQSAGEYVRVVSGDTTLTCFVGHAAAAEIIAATQNGSFILAGGGNDTF